MPSTFLRVLGPAALLLASSAVHAETFANAKGGYAFDLPAQWHLVNPNFMVQSSTGASLVEADLPPKGEHTLTKISKEAGMIACIGADYEATDERFDVTGEHWNGLVTVYQEPRRTGKLPRQVLQLVAQSGDDYRLFYYAVPTSEWMAAKSAILQQLKSLRFGKGGA